MDVKTQIKMLLKMYDNNEYDTGTFCNLFTELYFFEASGYRFFEATEREALDKLAALAERFTPFESDLVDYPNAYVSEEQIRCAFNELKRHESIWKRISK